MNHHVTPTHHKRTPTPDTKKRTPSGHHVAMAIMSGCYCRGKRINGDNSVNEIVELPLVVMLCDHYTTYKSLLVKHVAQCNYGK